MNLDEALLAGLAKHLANSEGELTYLKNGTTPVSASVYRSYQRDSSNEMLDAGFLEGLDNLYILAKTSDIGNWGLEPMKSKVFLDGQSFLVGRTIGKTNSYWQVYLRNAI